MKRFTNVDDMWIDAVKDLIRDGAEVDTRIGTSLETFAYQAALTNLEFTFLQNPRRDLCPYYACAELLWYLSHRSDISMIKAYAPQYANFAENDVAFGAYGDRLLSNLKKRDLSEYVTNEHSGDQLTLLINLLRKDENTRQAVVTLWEANDLAHAYVGDHKDLPCTLSLNFLIRDGRLRLVATMRSNDVWLGMPYDIFAFTGIQHVVAYALGVPCGAYVHQATSLHAYERDWQKIRDAIDVTLSPRALIDSPHFWGRCHTRRDWSSDVRKALRYEAATRNYDSYESHRLRTLRSIECDVLRDAAVCCGDKWLHTKQSWSITSHSLKAAMHRRRKV